jgi:hypothetical protein
MRIILTTSAPASPISAKKNGLPWKAARLILNLLRFLLRAMRTFFQALDILTIKLVGNPEAYASHPDHQQNLPSFHQFLPILWLQQIFSDIPRCSTVCA